MLGLTSLTFLVLGLYSKIVVGFLIPLEDSGITHRRPIEPLPEDAEGTAQIKPSVAKPRGPSNSNKPCETVVLFQITEGITAGCDGSSSSTSGTAPVTARDASTLSATASTTACAAVDTPCNYCAVALSVLNECVDSLNAAGLNSTYLSDCLCYEAFANSSDSGSDISLWAPNYFDQAWGNCLSWALTADTPDVSDVQSATSYCSSYGDYYDLSLTDTNTFVLAASEPMSTAAGTGNTGPVATSAIPTPAENGTDSPTATPASSAYKAFDQMTGMTAIIVAFVLLALAM